MDRPRFEAVIVITAILVLSPIAVLAMASDTSVAYALRGPITITGDSGFTASSGVVGGGGTYDNPYVISGWEISSASMGSFHTGISVTDTSNYFVIRDVYVHVNAIGIGLWNVSHCTIEDSVICGVSHGVLMSYGYDIALTGNTISGDVYCLSSNTVSLESNSMDSEFAVYYCSNVSARANLFDSGGIYIVSNSDSVESVLGNYASHTISPDNLVDGKPILYYENQQDLKIDSVPVGQLILVNCTNVSATNLDIDGASVGVNMVAADNVRIRNCTIENCTTAGIMAQWFTNATISDSVISNAGDYGLALFKSATVITNNKIENQSVGPLGSGILVGYSAKTWIRGNTICGNYFGMHVQASVEVDALITQNLISHNVNSVYVEGPATAFSSAPPARQESDSLFGSNVVIHHNIFGPLYGSATDLVGCVWDNGYPSGGNYWGDYEGIDEKSGPDQDQPGSDGIGDTPRSVPSAGVDRYPLMSLAFGPDMPPIASFTVTPESGKIGTVFVFNASSASDLEDPTNTLQVRWDWNNDGVWDTNWTNNKTAIHSYPTTGNYTVRLQVMDGSGLTDIYSKQIIVRNAVWSDAWLALPIIVVVAAASFAVFMRRGRRKRETA
jgi:nitrous oxidase accessory protein NosD